jgi:serine/threonine-protein kinase
VGAERWERVKLLVDQALSRDDAERDRFLAQACEGDATLRAEVESLLRHENEELLVSGGAADLTLADPQPPAAGPTTGDTLAHYRIVEPLGQGGMGMVYRAHDPTLGRDVALKLLLQDRFGDPVAGARLLREARSAARLNHPSICTVYEVGQAEGRVYIAMELLEGETLSARLARGPLPPDDFIRYALQLAEALVHAQERGLVHRDLKGANVLLSHEGRAKILDFGLAKVVAVEGAAEASTELNLTQPGAIVGTLAYMAPEQLRGEPADGRSDIWALGVLLYEMVTGSRPFQGQSGYELSASILNEPPRQMPASVPLALQALIERCLEKQPERRYQRAAEVRAALEAVQTGSVSPLAGMRFAARRGRRPWLVAALGLAAAGVAGWGITGLPWSPTWSDRGPSIRSLVVLPLANLSGDPAQEFFADGMTEALIAELSQIRGLEVVSRTSAMRYKQTTRPLPEIVDELGVDGVIEGGVLREGDTVRVTIKLVGGRTEKTLWARSFDRQATGILALYSDVVRAIASEVEVTLSPEEQALLARAGSVDPEAYEAYLKGRMHWYRQTPYDVDRAQQYFGMALEKDPTLALAHVGMGYVWTYYASVGLLPTEEMGERVMAAVRTAASIDPTLAEVHEAEADFRFYYDWDWDAAEESYRRAIELKPNSADMRLYYWEFLAAMRRFPEAQEQIQKCLELDPFNSYVQMSYGLFLLSSRRFEAAVAQFQDVLETNMDFGPAHLGLWQAHHHLGAYELALASAIEYFSKWDDREMAELLEAGNASGGYQEAMRRAAEGKVERAGRFTVLSLEVARLFAYAGDGERTLDWLEKAYEAHETGLVKLEIDPDWDGVRGEPRFERLVQRMDFPEA